MRTHRKWNVAVVSVVLALASTSAHAQTKDIVDTAVAAGSFNTLAAALQAADLVDALKGQGPFTVFAPTDEAFARLPQGTVETLLKPENKQQLVNVLTYHVVSGNVPAAQAVKLSGAKSLNGQQIDIKVEDGKVFVDKANVVTTDIVCTNGVIHVIDQVILPAADNLPTTAAKAGTFQTLVAAVKAAGLAEVLSSEGPFTVFAPTDEAFAKLPQGTVETLLQPENRGKLVSILKYHVVSGRVYSTDALAAGKAATLQGASVTITSNADGAMINDSKLIATDLDASNGVIHVIDSVLLPPENQQTAVQPRRMIEMAINKGAPLYNAGHAAACAQIYMTTVEQLLATNTPGLCTSTKQALHTALTTARHTRSADSQAWTLRHALDMAYNAMPRHGG